MPAPGLIQRCKIIEEAKQGNAPSVASTRAADCRWLSNRAEWPEDYLSHQVISLPSPCTGTANCNSVHLPCNCNKHFIPCLGFNDFFMAFFYTISSKLSASPNFTHFNMSHFSCLLNINQLWMLDAHFVLHIFRCDSISTPTHVRPTVHESRLFKKSINSIDILFFLELRFCC